MQRYLGLGIRFAQGGGEWPSLTAGARARMDFLRGLPNYGAIVATARERTPWFPVQAPPGMRRRHWLIMALFVVIGLVNSLDRATLSIANPLIRQDLGISVGQMGCCCRPSCGPMPGPSCRSGW